MRQEIETPSLKDLIICMKLNGMTDDECKNWAILIMREDMKFTFGKIANILEISKSQAQMRYEKSKDYGKLRFAFSEGTQK